MRWPFGGRTKDGALPAPAPEIIMAANGVYWRRYTEWPKIGTYSMVPVSDDNDPVLTPVAVYKLVGWEDHDGRFHPLKTDTRRTLSHLLKDDASESEA